MKITLIKGDKIWKKNVRVPRTREESASILEQIKSSGAEKAQWISDHGYTDDLVQWLRITESARTGCRTSAVDPILHTNAQ